MSGERSFPWFEQRARKSNGHIELYVYTKPVFSFDHSTPSASVHYFEPEQCIAENLTTHKCSKSPHTVLMHLHSRQQAEFSEMFFQDRMRLVRVPWPGQVLVKRSRDTPLSVLTLSIDLRSPNLAASSRIFGCPSVIIELCSGPLPSTLRIAPSGKPARGGSQASHVV